MSEHVHTRGQMLFSKTVLVQARNGAVPGGMASSQNLFFSPPPQTFFGDLKSH